MSNAANIAALEAAIAKGVLTVEADGRRVTYASTEQMLKAIEYFRGQDQAAASNGAQYAATLAVFGND